MVYLRTPTIEGLHEQEHGLHLRTERIELLFSGRHAGGEGWGFGFARQRVGWLGWRWWRIDWKLEIDGETEGQWIGRVENLPAQWNRARIEVGEGGGG